MADTDLPPAAAPAAAAPDGTTAVDGAPLGAHVPPGTLMERMGIELQEVSAERAVGTMPVAGNVQPYGLLHGGASAVLAETLGSYAANAHAGPDRRAVGIELSCTHHRSATEGVVTGTATAVHLGGRVATYDVVVSDPRGRRVCSARLTCMLIDARPA
jgi:uncharacterized protein (TIGR00369 family)